MRLARRVIAPLAAAAALAGSGAAGAAEVRFRGLLDVVAVDDSPAFPLNRLTRGDSPFDPYGLRVFADARVNDRIQVFAQTVLRDATAPYVDGAYAVFTPFPERDAHVLAGKIPWALGTWAPRTYSDHNPLVGTPLLYQHHTTMLFYEVAPDADALLATAGSGQWGVNYHGYREGVGMPIVDDSYWDVGVTLAGSARPFEAALGVTQGTPGWGSTSREENAGKTVLGRLGLTPHPALRIGVSGALGPYLLTTLEPALPPGKRATDYHQRLLMADLEWLAGHAELRAEGARNAWETPYVGDLDVTAGYVELKYLFDSGIYAAGRVDVERFGEITGSSGGPTPWDRDLDRFEGGLGYRFDSSVRGKLVYQHTRSRSGPFVDGRERSSLVAAQLSIEF